MARERRFTHMPMTKVRINLGTVVRGLRAERDNIVILEKDGIPVAALLDIDELEDLLDLHDPKLQRQIRQGWRDYKAGRHRSAEEFLNELGAKGAD